jgi:hypothetical protein
LIGWRAISANSFVKADRSPTGAPVPWAGVDASKSRTGAKVIVEPAGEGLSHARFLLRDPNGIVHLIGRYL